MTTADEVIATFGTGSVAHAKLDQWRQGRPRVAEVVVAHRTSVPYRTTTDDLRNVIARSEHALGDVSKDVAQSVEPIRDWYPEFAMTHVFHYILERLERAFTYQELRQFCGSDPSGRTMLWDPANQMIKDCADAYGEKASRQAMRWRIGNAYYSFLREIYTVVKLRDFGVDLRIHPLADALFRVDAWTERCVVSLYIGNSQFRNETEGRKPTPQSILGTESGFSFVSVNLRAQHVFGRLHAPPDADLERAARQIRAALAE